jgi:hypothetical protein
MSRFRFLAATTLGILLAVAVGVQVGRHRSSSLAPATMDNAASSVPQAAATHSADGTEAEQKWLDKNLPDTDVTKTSVDPGPYGRSMTLRREDSFHVAADDSDTWVFTVHHGANSDQSMYFDEQVETCQVKFKAIRWSDSVVNAVYEGSDEPNAYDPNDRVFSLLVPGTRSLTCTSNFREADKKDSTGTQPVLELTFETRDAAEATLGAIIKHANPEAARIIESQREWINTHLHTEDVKRSGPQMSAVGTIYISETESTQIYPLTVDHWRFESRELSHRTQGHEETDFRKEETCDVWPKKVDWSLTKLTRYEAANAENSPYFAWQTAPKGVLCDVVQLGGSFAPSHQEGAHQLTIFFKSKAAASTFVDNLTAISK